nr:MAG TPA: hypothetical protein [Caudoviricetes sp.]
MLELANPLSTISRVREIPRFSQAAHRFSYKDIVAHLTKLLTIMSKSC